jgi:hypothetical protein
VKFFQNGNNNNNNKGIFYQKVPIFEKKFEKKLLHLDFDFGLVAF